MDRSVRECDDKNESSYRFERGDNGEKERWMDPLNRLFSRRLNSI